MKKHLTKQKKTINKNQKPKNRNKKTKTKKQKQKQTNKVISTIRPTKCVTSKISDHWLHRNKIVCTCNTQEMVKFFCLDHCDCAYIATLVRLLWMHTDQTHGLSVEQLLLVGIFSWQVWLCLWPQTKQNKTKQKQSKTKQKTKKHTKTKRQTKNVLSTR